MASRPAANVGQFIADVASALDRRHIPFMLIGGQAVLVHGQPRLTEDIDITLGVAPSELATILLLCDALGLIPLPKEIESFVRDTFVLPARHAGSRLRVDFIFSTTPYEHQAIARAERIDVGGTSVPFATAEDLIVHKLFAGRPRDHEDVRGVVRRKGTDLDWQYITTWATAFAEIPGREDLPRQVAELQAETRNVD
jgi:predicted nucleotidyltransferase